MFPFQKKKEEEEEKDILDEDLPSKKKFRDLKPENKKKRKEPTKPWGKNERILVLVVLGLTVGISIILSAISRGNLQLPSISIAGIKVKSGFSFDNLFGETFTFNSVNNPNCCDEPVKNFRKLTNDLSGEYSFYVIDLNSSREYGYNENDSFKAASLIKIPTVVALYKESEEGLINLDDKYTLQDSDKADGNGSLEGYNAGTQLTYRKIAELMLSQSDNTAFNILEKQLGDRKIQDTVLALGENNTSIYDNFTSAKDIANLLKKISNADILNRRDSDEILSYLEDTNFDSWLVAGLPSGIKVAHKIGSDIGVTNDAGIVYTENPYIVVILSKDNDETEANTVLTQISRAIYNFEIGN